MMNINVTKRIQDFVYLKPRTVQEIAHLIDKNWRTADSYVNKIIEQTGTLSVRTFREGTRGALKIVYWSNIEKIHANELQEELFKRIISGRNRKDFSPLDIFQHIPANKKHARIQFAGARSVLPKDEIKLFNKSKKQILSFSGNLSWIRYSEKQDKIEKVLERISQKKIAIKILSRIDIAGVDNVRSVLAINKRTGKDLIEVRHCEQPLRGFIIDGEHCKLLERLDPQDYPQETLKKVVYIDYDIYDKEWIEWLQKVFWCMFRTATPANKRVTAIEGIQNIIKM